MLTQDQTRRVLAAIEETRRMLARAMRYSPQFRDNGLIASYEAHLVKMNAMLVGGAA